MCWSPSLLALTAFGARLLLRLAALLFARGRMLLEELVPVLAEVGRVDDLVEELFGFFFLLVRVRVGSVVLKVICGAVGGVDHKCCLEQVCFGWESIAAVTQNCHSAAAPPSCS